VTTAAGIGQFAAIQAVGPIGIELSAIDLRDVGEIEACRCGIRARIERRAGGDGKSVWDKSSRCDRNVGGPVKAAHGLSLPLLRQRRRLDLLRA
jgi:hypothetical protein